MVCLDSLEYLVFWVCKVGTTFWIIEVVLIGGYCTFVGVSGKGEMGKGGDDGFLEFTGLNFTKISFSFLILVKFILVKKVSF